MSWIRSSRTVVLVALFALALGVAGTAVAVDFNEDGVPEDAEVGETETVAVSFDPFADRSAPLLVEAESELDDVTITLDADGESISADGTLEEELDDEGIREVTIEASGDVPEIEEYDYEDKDIENILGLRVSFDGAQVGSWDVHRYTEDSKDARNAIDEASEAVAGTDNEEAENELDDAIAFYNSQEFDRAIDRANNAKDIAESEGETTQMLLIGGAVVVVLAAVAGGVYVWRSRQQDTNRLQ